MRRFARTTCPNASRPTIRTTPPRARNRRHVVRFAIVARRDLPRTLILARTLPPTVRAHTLTLPRAARTFTIRTRVTRREPSGGAVRNTARRQVLVGALSIALWFTVAAAGRWIGFS